MPSTPRTSTLPSVDALLGCFPRRRGRRSRVHRAAVRLAGFAAPGSQSGSETVATVAARAAGTRRGRDPAHQHWVPAAACASASRPAPHRRTSIREHGIWPARSSPYSPARCPVSGPSGASAAAPSHGLSQPNSAPLAGSSVSTSWPSRPCARSRAAALTRRPRHAQHCGCRPTGTPPRPCRRRRDPRRPSCAARAEAHPGPIPARRHARACHPGVPEGALRSPAARPGLPRCSISTSRHGPAQTVVHRRQQPADRSRAQRPSDVPAVMLDMLCRRFTAIRDRRVRKTAPSISQPPGPISTCRFSLGCRPFLPPRPE